MVAETKSKPSSKKEGTAASPGTSELTTVPGATALPTFMQGDAASRVGKENIKQDDLIIPRVALMQAVSPEVIDGNVESGHFWHTIAEEDLGEAIEDLVILHHSKRYTLWNPRHAGGGVLARASDGMRWDSDFDVEVAPYKDRPKQKVRYTGKAGDRVGRDIGLGKWGSMDPENADSPPAATLTHVLACAILSRLDMGPFVILLQRSAEPVAKMLLSKVSIDPAPIFGQIYSVTSKDQPSDSGDFKQFVFAKNGHVQDERMYMWLQEQHKNFAALGVKYDEAAEQPEGAPVAEGADASGGGGRY